MMCNHSYYKSTQVCSDYPFTSQFVSQTTLHKSLPANVRVVWHGRSVLEGLKVSLAWRQSLSLVKCVEP